MIIVLRSQMQKQTVSNLITAGVIEQEEAEVYYNELSNMTVQELLSTLVESHQLREECSNPIDYYSIGEISQN